MRILHEVLRPRKGPDIIGFFRDGTKPDALRPSELVRPEGLNSFADFIALNAPMFDEYAQASRTVRGKKRELEDDISQLVDRQMRNALIRFDSRDISALKGTLHRMTYYRGPEEARTKELDGLVRSKFSNKRDQVYFIQQMVADMAAKTSLDLQPRVDHLNSLRVPLLAGFSEFLTDSYQHVIDLDIFLAGNEFKDHRELAGEFLADVAEADVKARGRREVTRIDLAKKYWAGTLNETFVPEVFAAFWEDELVPRGGAVFEQLVFYDKLLRNSKGESIEGQPTVESLKLGLSRFKVEEWPESLRAKYRLFGKGEVDNRFGKMTTNLHAKYPRANEKPKAPTVISSVSNSKRRNQGTPEVTIEEVQHDQEPDKEDGIDNTIARLKVAASHHNASHYVETTSESDQDLIWTLAKKAATSEKMARDLVSVLQALKKVRIGLNFSTNTVADTVTVDGQKLQLWEIDPRDFSDISFSDPKTRDMRMLVAFQGGRVLVKGIYDHAEFDRIANKKTR